MDLIEAKVLLNKFLGSNRLTQLKEKQNLRDSNFILDKLERIGFNFGVVLGKEPRLSTNVTLMFGFTGKNNSKSISINDFDPEKAKQLEEAWMVFAKDKLSQTIVETDIGF